MQLFYQKGISLSNKDGFLSLEESRHVIKSLRLKSGDILHVTDGRGHLYQARITDSNPKKTAYKLIGLIEKEEEKDYRIHVAVAPTKNADRIEWFVEKAVEMGIDEISFVLCRYSEKQNLRMDRLERIKHAAMKQSLKYSSPILNETVPLKEFFERDLQGGKFMAYVKEDTEKHLFSLAQPKGQYNILIGPEGGFSDKEAAMAQELGWQCCSLGPSRLRTETAAMYSCAALNLLNEALKA